MNEEERVPTYTALWRHWLRSCWVSQMWRNSTQSDLYASLPPPENSGWIRLSDESYTIDWEAPEVQEKITTTIQLLTRGCHCKKGCKSNACGCRKKFEHCGPGCECHCCTNLPAEPVQETTGDTNNESDDSSSASDNEAYSDADNIQSEVVTEEFLFTIPDIL